MSGTDEPRPATVDDVALSAAVLADAFFDDPVFRFLFPDDSERPRLAQAMFTMLGEHVYLPLGECLVATDAAAYWEPPGAPGNDDFWVDHGEAFVAALDGQVERLVALSTAMDAHHPSDPCWYLSLLGVRPSAQGRGLGGRLLTHKLEQIDAGGGAGLPRGVVAAEQAALRAPRLRAARGVPSRGRPTHVRHVARPPLTWR